MSECYTSIETKKQLTVAAANLIKQMKMKFSLRFIRKI